MDCPEEALTSAYIDGELDEAQSAAAEAHIATCAHCQALVAAAAEISEALRGPTARLTAPPDLAARVGRALDAETVRERRPQRAFIWGALSGVGASALAAAAALILLLPPPTPALEAALTEAHTDALMSGRTAEVVSTSHHTVKPWFAGRTAFSPPVADFAAQGFALAGGRIDDVMGLKTAVVTYRHGAHEIDLFVWPAAERPAPASGARLGYHLMGWRSGDLAFAAVSDVETGELSAFTDLVKAERE